MRRRRCPVSKLLRGCCAALLASLLVRADEETDAVIARHRQTTQMIVDNWHYDRGLVCLGANVHGFVEKKATGNSIQSMLHLTREKVAIYAEAGVPIYDGVQVFISEMYKFIYVRQPKSSSTSIIAAIRQTFCGGTKHCRETEFREMDTMVSDEIWNEYFVFTCVRNPFARMISTYNMFKNFMYTRIRNETHPEASEAGEHCHLPFLDYSYNAFKMRSVCETDNCCTYFKGMKKWYPSFVNLHINAQAQVVFTQGGDSVVDYIARTENIGSDWEDIVSRILVRSGQEIRFFPISNVNGKHHNMNVAIEDQHPCLPPDIVQMGLLNETTVLSIAKQFSMDFVALQFLASPPVGRNTT